MQRIVLASASPRRRELLAQAGVSFEIIPAKGEEVITKTVPSEVVEELATQKAAEVAGQIEEGIIIGADTVVCQNGQIMGKPADEENAWQMLRSIQGNTHSVFTGVSVIVKKKNVGKSDSEKGYSDAENSGKENSGNENSENEYSEERITFSCETKVQVYSMTEQETRDYIATGEPMDKAGAYGIQGKFGIYVKGIEGDYNNVVGLPVSALWQVLKKYLGQLPEHFSIS